MPESGVFEIINFEPDLDVLEKDIRELDREKHPHLMLDISRVWGPVFLEIAVWIQTVWPECGDCFAHHTWQLMNEIQRLMDLT